MPFTINKSAVPSKIQATDFFVRFESDFVDFLTKPENQKAIGIHEGSHAFFLVRAGAKDIKFEGPRIFLRGNKLVAHSASTIADSIDTEYLAKINVAQSITATAQAYAAGSAAVEELLKLPYFGDADDFEFFQAWYEPAQIKHEMTESFEVAWPILRESIKKLLRENEPIKQAVLNLADETEKLLFSSNSV